jgi:hypothetical protein
VLSSRSTTVSATLKTAGTQSLTVSDPANPGLSGTEGSILVNPAAASRPVINAPRTVKSGVPFSLTLTVEDAYGNVVTGYTTSCRNPWSVRLHLLSRGLPLVRAPPLAAPDSGRLPRWGHGGLAQGEHLVLRAGRLVPLRP